jgi:hypothetical protein
MSAAQAAPPPLAVPGRREQHRTPAVPRALPAGSARACLACHGLDSGGQQISPQARILAFSCSNSALVMTPWSRKPASLVSWSAGVCEPAASWT